MKKIVVISLLIFGFLLVSNNLYGNEIENLGTGNHFYKLWKDYKTVYIDDKNTTPQKLSNANQYGYYIVAYLDTIFYFDVTEIPDEITYEQVQHSFGKFLENNPEIRHYHIQTLLSFWEKVTFKGKDLDKLKKIYSKFQKIKKEDKK